ncbi:MULTISPECIES: type II toxin-antitoxin system ParD family antitoxin [Photorhabdus]|uniref:Type II toxin-antitoxin system ParD family antitoxin n=1 Tax=Photorhabdus bodei TaxID=2029681 RepID=A0AAW6BHE6_9GAMM|nr:MULTISPECIES: type II toxin-antitoxin system ParD family antitoxin [Photorhabdus]MCT8352352.1 type II toxin-antitoxin system ParD family antitoxin [Photorhabdus kayaii]MDB6370992.1 type II toxin-antitoxin system ParD family antitoxin [Photorhabdus bodei]
MARVTSVTLGEHFNGFVGDMIQSGRYTIQQFGQNQARRYHDELLKRTFELLATSPLVCCITATQAFISYLVIMVRIMYIMLNNLR